ncbi:MAG: insulinase family protein, partial [Firmicutes bacterium]|nr:insulinase family protein [Bacillota bacterium]
PPAHKVERMDVTQGKLCLGYVTPITIADPEYPAMQVLDTILGGGMTSKLFLNVREKQSLCYAIGSGYYGSKGIMTISAGIDPQQEQTVRAEIAGQLDACRRGEISGQELDAAKEARISGLRAVHDSPGAIEGYYATAALSGFPRSPQARMADIAAVTAEQAARAAESLTLQASFFLTGGDPS